MGSNFFAEEKTIPFEQVLSVPLRNGIYKKKEFHGRGGKIINMGELFAHPRITSEVDMKRVELTGSETRKASIDSGDLIFARRSLTAEGAGKCAIVLSVNEATTFESSIIRARLNKEIANPEYYYYLFNSPFGKHLLGTILRQVAVSGITGSDLAKLEVPVPPVLYQNKVVSVLRSLDDKIQINHQINQTLEQMAQTLFKSWFVDFEPVKAKIAARQRWQAMQPVAEPASPVCYAAELEDQPALGDLETYINRAAMQAISGKTLDQLDALYTEDPERYNELYKTAELFPSAMQASELGEVPEGWSCQSLDSVAKYQNGLALQKFRPENEDDYLPVVKIAQLKKGYADGVEKASPNIKPGCIIDNGDVVFSWSGSLMVDTWCGGKAALNQHLFKVTSDTYPKWLYLLFTRHHLEEFQRIAADKAVTMGHIKREHLRRALCAIPTEPLIKKSGNSLSNIIEKQIELRLESTTLSTLRDTLLPKLLSGELTISEAEARIAEIADA